MVVLLLDVYDIRKTEIEISCTSCLLVAKSLLKMAPPQECGSVHWT